MFQLGIVPIGILTTTDPSTPEAKPAGQVLETAGSKGQLMCIKAPCPGDGKTMGELLKEWGITPTAPTPKVPGVPYRPGQVVVQKEPFPVLPVVIISTAALLVFGMMTLGRTT